MPVLCGNCSKRISSKADVCPKCGYPIGNSLKPKTVVVPYGIKELDHDAAKRQEILAITKARLAEKYPPQIETMLQIADNKPIVPRITEQGQNDIFGLCMASVTCIIAIVCCIACLAYGLVFGALVSIAVGYFFGSICIKYFKTKQDNEARSQKYQDECAAYDKKAAEREKSRETLLANYHKELDLCDDVVEVSCPSCHEKITLTRKIGNHVLGHCSSCMLTYFIGSMLPDGRMVDAYYYMNTFYRRNVYVHWLRPEYEVKFLQAADDVRVELEDFGSALAEDFIVLCILSKLFCKRSEINFYKANRITKLVNLDALSPDGWHFLAIMLVDMLAREDLNSDNSHGCIYHIVFYLLILRFMESAPEKERQLVRKQLTGEQFKTMYSMYEQHGENIR